MKLTLQKYEDTVRRSVDKIKRDTNNLDSIVPHWLYASKLLDRLNKLVESGDIVDMDKDDFLDIVSNLVSHTITISNYFDTSVVDCLIINEEQEATFSLSNPTNYYLEMSEFILEVDELMLNKLKKERSGIDVTNMDIDASTGLEDIHILTGIDKDTIKGWFEQDTLADEVHFYTTKRVLSLVIYQVMHYIGDVVDTRDLTMSDVYKYDLDRFFQRL